MFRYAVAVFEKGRMMLYKRFCRQNGVVQFEYAVLEERDFKYRQCINKFVLIKTLTFLRLPCPLSRRPEGTSFLPRIVISEGAAYQPSAIASPLHPRHLSVIKHHFRINKRAPCFR